MCHEPHNPNDPLFAVSRDLDADLSETEQRALSDALSGSAGLKQQAAELATVHALVARWAERRPSVHADRFAEDVCAKLAAAEPHEPGFGEVDRLIQRWAGTYPHSDAPAFTEAVMGRIRVRPGRWAIFRIAAPLAAAAAVVMALTASLWEAGQVAARVQVSVGPPSRGAFVSGEDTAPRVIVSFARRPSAPKPEAASRPGISFAIVGTAAAFGVGDAEPPL